MDCKSEQQDFVFDWEILLEADLSLPDSEKIHVQFTKVYLDDTDKWTSEIDNKLGEFKIAASPSTTSDPSEPDFSFCINDQAEEQKSSEEEYADPDAADKIAMGLPSAFGALPKPSGSKRRRTTTKDKRKDMDFDTYWKTFGKMFVTGVEELKNSGAEADITNTNFANALDVAATRCSSLLKDHRKIDYFRDFVFANVDPSDGKGDGQSLPKTADDVKELIRRDMVNVGLLQSRNRAEMFSKKLYQFSYVSGFKIGFKNKDGVFERPKSSEEVLSPFTSVKFVQHEPVYFGKIKRKNYSLHADDVDIDAPIEADTVPVKMEESDPKNFDFSFDPVRDSKLIAKNALTIFGANHKLLKYWHQRYRLFSKLNNDILMDEEGWFSVTPELIAEHIADRMVTHKNCVILDAFTGVGGNAIQFALRGALVYAIDLDPIKLRCARQNAKVYGVEDKITFICGNFYHIAKSLCQSSSNAGLLPIDSVFLSPPWGGPEYLHLQVFELSSCVPDGFDIFRIALKISPNIAYFLPRNTSSKQLLEIAGDTDSRKVEVEHNVLNNKIKALTAYYGNLVSASSH